MTSDQVLGALVGGAMGDIIGGVLERSTLAISDDTQLTLATCEAIIEAGSVSPDVIASTFLRWYRQRRFSGLGSATLKALRDLDAGGHWAQAGARGEMAAGNGAAMRIAPLAFLLDLSDPDARTLLRDVSRITHHNEEAYVGALAVCIAIQSGPVVSSSAALACVAGELPDSRVRDRLLSLAALPEGSDIAFVGARFGASGYVVDTVPLAVFASQRSATMPLGSIFAALVEAGGDADTTCSIAGQIAGAHLGFSALPPDLLHLVSEEEVLGSARRFATEVLAVA
jgi:ADP-ribosyl-[dinitrogen reductase] hydrolase